MPYFKEYIPKVDCFKEGVPFLPSWFSGEFHRSTIVLTKKVCSNTNPAKRHGTKNKQDKRNSSFTLVIRPNTVDVRLRCTHGTSTFSWSNIVFSHFPVGQNMEKWRMFQKIHNNCSQRTDARCRFIIFFRSLVGLLKPQLHQVFWQLHRRFPLPNRLRLPQWPRLPVCPGGILMPFGSEPKHGMKHGYTLHNLTVRTWK